MRTLFMLLFSFGFCAMAAAQQLTGQALVDRENVRLTNKGDAVLSVKEVADLKTRGWRNRRTGEFWPPVGRTFRPSDYVDAGERGTIEYSDTWRNYAYHQVTVPDGTTFTDRNFVQLAPGTEVFDRSPGHGHNLEFSHCNLVNVKTYDDWVLSDDCNNNQVDRIGTITDEDGIQVTETVHQARTYKGLDLFRIRPIGALK